MNRDIDFSQMPNLFGTCNVTNCPLAETCLRHLAHDKVSSKEPFINVLNHKWLAQQKKRCQFYLKNEPVKRARGFKRLLGIIPAGKIGSFRMALLSRMGYRRYYQARKGEILLTEAEENMVIKQAKRFGVVMDDYFDKHEMVLMWHHE